MLIQRFHNIIDDVVLIVMYSVERRPQSSIILIVNLQVYIQVKDHRYNNTVLALLLRGHSHNG